MDDDNTGAREPDRPGWLPVIPRVNLATRSAEILKSHIVRANLPPGYRLPAERRLSDWLNVSRTVVRLALAQLEEEGVLYRPSPRILCVGEFDRAAYADQVGLAGAISREQRDLIEFRGIVELGALELALARMSEADLRDVEHWVADGERRFAEQKPIYPADANFHATLFRIADNTALASLLPIIQESMRFYLVLNPYQLNWDDETMAATIVNEHRQIFEALRARDLPVAQERMRVHLQRNLDVADHLKVQVEAAGVTSAQSAEAAGSGAGSTNSQRPTSA